MLKIMLDFRIGEFGLQKMQMQTQLFPEIFLKNNKHNRK